MSSILDQGDIHDIHKCQPIALPCSLLCQMCKNFKVLCIFVYFGRCYSRALGIPFYQQKKKRLSGKNNRGEYRCRGGRRIKVMGILAPQMPIPFCAPLRLACPIVPGVVSFFLCVRGVAHPHQDAKRHTAK